jgi:signal peptidase II
VLGGALGNYLDRLARGFVIDFIEAHWHERATWPSFNVADSCIVVGVGLLLLDGLLRRESKAEVSPGS